MSGTVVAIDASTYAGTVAVLHDGSVVADATVAMRGEREERLMPAVADAMRSAGTEPRAVGRVVCGAGPGSFTSLRIAGSLAKGLAFSSRATLHPVSSLMLIVAAAPALVPGRYVAVLDAMRGDVFAALFTLTGARLAAEGNTVIMPRATVPSFAAGHNARLIGPGQPIDAWPHARGAAVLGPLAEWPGPADVASWEPDYGRLAEAQVRWEAAHGRPLAGP